MAIDKLYSVTEVSGILGVSKRTVVRLQREGRLEVVRIGLSHGRDRVLFTEDGLRRFIEESTVHARME